MMTPRNCLTAACRDMVLVIMETHPHPRMTLPIMLNRMAREGFDRPQTRAAVDFHTKRGNIWYDATSYGVELSLPSKWGVK